MTNKRQCTSRAVDFWRLMQGFLADRSFVCPLAMYLVLVLFFYRPLATLMGKGVFFYRLMQRSVLMIHFSPWSTSRPSCYHARKICQSTLSIDSQAIEASEAREAGGERGGSENAVLG